jgi:hypothetical protein
MLVYVAQLLLSWLVHGAWRDPDGFGFPQSKLFEPAARMPVILAGTRLNIGFAVALAAAAAIWILLARLVIGFQLKVVGQAPLAARYAGFSSRRALWLALLIAGALAGIAGGVEATGPIGQLTPTISPGYGFAAIIVAFVGRLHPLGVRARRPADGVVLYRRRACAIPPGIAGCAHRCLSGAAAVFPARLRHVDRVSRPAAPNNGGGPRLMEAVASLAATTMAAGTPLLLAALGIRRGRT